MANIEIGWLASLIVAVSITLLFVVYTTYRARLETRRSSLEAASFALQSHYDAVRKIIEDPAPSMELKDSLVRLTYAISIHRVACSIAENVYNRTFFSQNKFADDDDKQLYSELEILQRTRPDLMELIDVAVGSGITALFLRWPETSRLLDKMVAQMESSRAKKLKFARRISQLVTSNGENDNTGNGHFGTINCRA